MQKQQHRSAVLFPELNWSHTAIHRSDPWIPPITYGDGKQTPVQIGKLPAPRHVQSSFEFSTKDASEDETESQQC